MIPGCDDARTVTVPQGERAKRVTFVYPYYENAKFLTRQLQLWSSYRRDLQEQLSVIVVDDGSPSRPAEETLRAWHSSYRWRFPVRMFRIDVDVRWNWLAARNVGMHYAQPGWTLMTDMDHLVPEQTLSSLTYGVHDESVIYRLSRTGTKTTPHPNSWFVTREMFWRVGGYDESASGYYGTDGEYRRRCAATAPVKILTDALEHHEHESDASTTRYGRKQPEDARGKEILRARRNQTPKILSFPYHEVVL